MTDSDPRRERCASEVMQLDDRWGSLGDRCDLSVGHPGPHVADRTACMPRAWLSWWDAEHVAGD